MKRLLLYLLLAFSVIGFTPTYSQDASTMLLLMGDEGYANTETTLYLAGQTVTPTQATRIDNFITMLKDSLQISLLSQKFDVMYLLANESAALGLRNLVKRSHDATAVNSPTFTQWEGFAGDGTSSYINANYNPSTEGVKFLQNDASVSIYVRTNTNDLKVLIGAYDGTNYTQIYTSNGALASANLNNGPYTNTQATTQGFNVVSRTGSTAGARYLNGTINSTTVGASAVRVNKNLTLLARNAASLDNFTTNQIAFAGLGAGLTAPEVSKLYNCIQWYMTQLGKQV